MHFSIPDTQEFIENTGSVYVGYNIHINGLFHCIVRYKQLLNLHEQLEKDLEVNLPPFPPKKFFPLTMSQQEERRLALEKYIQMIGQNAVINRSELLNGFLLNAQIETAGYAMTCEDLEVFLLNGRKIILNVNVAEHSGTILHNICRNLKLPEKYDSYFSLFVMIYEENGDINILRKMQEFESPVLTMRNIQRGDVRLVLGKWYWDTESEIETTNNTVVKNLLAIQAAAEIERGWILAPHNLKSRLKSLQDNNEDRKYLDIARTLKYYGYVHFAPCYCDYPESRTIARAAIGKNELNLRISAEGQAEREFVFKVTHMRCWRITTVHNGADKFEDTADFSYELSFEYLMAKNTLAWITLTSDQAILMSVCIQSMIDELLLKNVVGSRNQGSPKKPWTYVMRDGHSRILIGSPSPEHSRRNQKAEDTAQKSEPMIKRITDKLSVTYLRKLSKSSSEDGYCSIEHDTRENRAFGVIGDDDL